MFKTFKISTQTNTKADWKEHSARVFFRRSTHTFTDIRAVLSLQCAWARVTSLHPPARLLRLVHHLATPPCAQNCSLQEQSKGKGGQGAKKMHSFFFCAAVPCHSQQSSPPSTAVFAGGSCKPYPENAWIQRNTSAHRDIVNECSVSDNSEYRFSLPVWDPA